jgi:hypothetical protein
MNHAPFERVVTLPDGVPFVFKILASSIVLVAIAVSWPIPIQPPLFPSRLAM